VRNRSGRTFSPVQLDDAGTLDEIARILRDELHDTLGLIIDVRNNGGGSINLADELPQLFSANPVAVNGFPLLNTDLNATIVHAPGFPDAGLAGADRRGARHQRAIHPHGAAHDTAAATGARRCTSSRVAILTDASCYSACDMFTASMQDNALAKVWGEGETTGHHRRWQADGDRRVHRFGRRRRSQL